MSDVKIFIISEDSSKASFEIIKNIISKSLRLIEPSYNINKIQFIEKFNSSKVVKGSYWKEKCGKDFRELIMSIMNELKKENCYFFWHIDGDIQYSSFLSNPNNSNNYQMFYDKISKIPHTVRINGQSTDIDFTKLFLLFPCYSIEAWLYPFLESIEIDESHNFNLEDIEISEYDNIKKIKDVSGILDFYNLSLSTKFNHSKLFELNKSYAYSFNKYFNHVNFNNTIKSIIQSW